MQTRRLSVSYRNYSSFAESKDVNRGHLGQPAPHAFLEPAPCSEFPLLCHQVLCDPKPQFLYLILITSLANQSTRVYLNENASAVTVAFFWTLIANVYS